MRLAEADLPSIASATEGPVRRVASPFVASREGGCGLLLLITAGCTTGRRFHWFSKSVRSRPSGSPLARGSGICTRRHPVARNENRSGSSFFSPSRRDRPHRLLRADPKGPIRRGRTLHFVILLDRPSFGSTSSNPLDDLAGRCPGRCWRSEPAGRVSGSAPENSVLVGAVCTDCRSLCRSGCDAGAADSLLRDVVRQTHARFWSASARLARQSDPGAAEIMGVPIKRD